MLLGLAGLALTASCAQESGVASVLLVASVQVTPPSSSLVPGETLQLVATPKTEGGLSLPARDVAWSSSDPSVATVSSDGLVRAFAVGGPVRIRATVEGVTGETLITVVPLPVDHVVVTPAQGTILAGQATQLTATAYDAQGTVLSGRTFFWASDAASIAAVTTTGLVLGLAPGGPVAITANAEGKSGSAIVSVSRRPASRLGFGQQPGQAIAGIPLTPAVQVLIQDDLLGTVTDATTSVTIGLAGNPGGASLSGATTVTAVNGVATFANLVLDRAVTGYSLMATSPGLVSAISNPFTVVAGAPNRLAMIAAPPSTVQSGVAFGNHPVVQIRDGSGNPVARSGVPVTASIASGNGTLSGTLTVSTDASGTATFSNLSLGGPVGGFTLSFSSPGIAPVTSGNISLGAGLPATLGIVTQPSVTAQSGVAFARQPVVRVLDAWGNTVPQSGVIITAAVASGPPGGSLGGAAGTSTSSSGVAAFAGLRLTGPAGSYVLGFGAAGLPGITSTPIALAAGPGAGLSLTTQPSPLVSNGTAFPQQPVVQLRDAANNPVAQAGVLIAASIQTGGGQLGGATTVATDATGAATFTNLAITGQTGGRTLLFASPGYASVVSGTISVVPGVAVQLGVTGQPSASAKSGVPFLLQPVIQIQDVSGNPVARSGMTITASLASGPSGGSLGGGTVVTTDANGAAAYSDLSVTGPGGAYTIAFAGTMVSGATSNSVTLGAGTGTTLSLLTQPSTAAVNAAVFTQQPVVQLVDGSGNPVSQAGVPVSVTLSGTGGVLGGVSIVNTDASGRAAFTGLSITGKTGSYTLAFSAPGLTGVSSGAIALGSGPAVLLSITTQPSASARSGVAFFQQPVIQIQDASGNPVSLAGMSITASLASGPSGGSLGGATVVTTDANGAAAYSNLSLAGPAGAYTLAFAGTMVSGATSNPVTLGAGTGTSITLVTQPSSAAVNAAVFPQQPVLQLVDGFGNPVSQAGVPVSVALSGSGGVLGGTSTVSTDASGRAGFTGLSITGKTGNYALMFSAPGTAGVTSGVIALGAGPASQLGIQTQPSASAQSGVPFPQQPVVQLLDVSGNPVSQAGTSITASLASGPAGGSLGGTAVAITDGNGAAAYANLSVTGPAGSYTLGFAGTGLSGATSAAVTLGAGSATSLSIMTQPSSAAVNVAVFPQQPVLQLMDGSGNPVSQAGVPVSVALSGSGGVLGGTSTVSTDASGRAGFTGLSITGKTGNYALMFSAPGTAGVTSGVIALGTGPASQLGIQTQPSASAQSGVPFPQQPVVQLLDVSGNPVSQAGTSITVSLASGPAGGSLGGTALVVTDAKGVAVYSNLSVTGPAGSYTLAFAGGGLSGAISAAVTLGAGSATSLSIVTQPSSAAVNAAVFPQQPVLQLMDGSGNPVAQAGVPVSVALSGSGGVLGGTSTLNTDASGRAAFAGLSITGKTGNYTLGFSGPGLAGVTSTVVVLAPGPAALLTIVTQPSPTATNGVAFARQPVVQVSDVSGNPVSQAPVTAAIGSGGGNLGGSPTVGSNASGAATFSGLSITGLAGPKTLSFAAPGVSPVGSSSIALTAGPASQLIITTQPSSTAQSGVAFPQQPIVRVADISGNPVGGVVVTVAIASGGGGLGGTSSATSNASGNAVFAGLSISGTVGSRTLAFAASGLPTVTSSPINLIAGPGTQLVIVQEPSTSARRNTPFARQPIVRLRDGAGNAVAGASVTASINSGIGGGKLNGTRTVTTDAAGLATFTDLEIHKQGFYNLKFTSGQLTVVSSVGIGVN